MGLILLIILFSIGAIVAPKFIKDRQYGGQVQSMKLVRWAVQGTCAVLAFICFLCTSCVTIDSNKLGHMKRIYWGRSMPAGRIIAAPNEKGLQAKTIKPGFHIIPFVRVTHDIEQLPIVHVEQGKYGFLVAKDGNPMPAGQFIAPEWNNTSDMIDAITFMGYDEGNEGKGPRGIKGPQLTVLPPGDYFVNRYLFKVFEGNSTPVPAGHVAVIKSNVGEDYHGEKLLPTGIKNTDLSVPIVPKGYRGVWKEVMNPGEYYINTKAYDVTIVDTRVQTWLYLGGYTRKWIDLTVGDDGKIHQEPHEEEVKTPAGSDSAIVLRVEGWDVFQDSRVQVQVTPENAPFVVASVGGLEQVRDKIITPNYRSIIRNVVSQPVTVEEPVLDENGEPVHEAALDKDGKEIKGTKGKIKTHTVTRPRQVLDLLYHRKELEKGVAEDLVPTSAQAGVTVQWVRFGDPAVPPSLLLPGKRQQLAKSLIATYKQEKSAQIERVNTERERARADQQAELMKSEIGIKVAENHKEARTKEGEGEKAYLTLVAQGQEKQANVLGKEKAFELAFVEKVLNAAAEHPEMIKYPGTLVMGADGGGLSGAAAILGQSNLTMGMQNLGKK